MRFTKVHSLGNDFIVLDPEESSGIVDVPGLTRRLCDRHLGVGADGLLLISIKDRERGLVHFRIFNADGSEPEISGNGLRCAAAYLFHQKKIQPPDVTFLTSIGTRLCNLLEVRNNRSQIRIEMGTPRLTSKTQEGLIITQVKRFSEADRKGLAAGDIIIEVNRKKVATVDELERMMSKFESGQAIILLVRREQNGESIDRIVTLRVP